MLQSVPLRLIPGIMGCIRYTGVRSFQPWLKLGLKILFCTPVHIDLSALNQDLRTKVP